jgi:hypothetical protein
VRRECLVLKGRSGKYDRKARFAEVFAEERGVEVYDIH